MTLNQIKTQEGKEIFTFRSNRSGKTFDVVRESAGGKMLVREVGSGEEFLLKVTEDRYTPIILNPRIVELKNLIEVKKTMIENAENELDLINEELNELETELDGLEG